MVTHIWRSKDKSVASVFVPHLYLDSGIKLRSPEPLTGSRYQPYSASCKQLSMTYHTLNTVIQIHLPKADLPRKTDNSRPKNHLAPGDTQKGWNRQAREEVEGKWAPPWAEHWSLSSILLLHIINIERAVSWWAGGFLKQMTAAEICGLRNSHQPGNGGARL